MGHNFFKLLSSMKQRPYLPRAQTTLQMALVMDGKIRLS